MKTTKYRVYATARAIGFWLIPTWVWLIFGKWGLILAPVQVLCLIALISALKVVWEE